MKPHDDQQLWDLLGHGTAPKVSPFFSRNVLRQVRQEKGTSRGWKFWLAWPRLLPATGALAAICAFALVHGPLVERPTPVLDSVAEIDAQDYDELFDFEDLIAFDDSDLADDSLL